MNAQQEFDLIVIGAGPAGENVAGICAQAGLDVAIVEDQLVGGECSYWGCIPSKVLIRPGDVLAAARRVPGAAPAVRGDVDAAATFALRDKFAGDWDDRGALPWLTERGVEVVRGRGRLTGTREVAVEPSDGAARRIKARRAVVLATGTSAAMPPIPGLAEAGFWTNRDATAAKQVPPRLIVLGGGAIGLEMAQAFRRLGSQEVTVVEAGSRLLPREEPFAASEIRAALEAEGIAVHTGTAVATVYRSGDGPVTARLTDGTAITADEILVAAGRRPATDNLGLDSVGLVPGRYVEVDDQLRATGVQGGWLYAVGDCNGRALLTHMAKYQARVAADVILGQPATAISDHQAVPRVTFTDPQVCAVGLTEEQARQSGIDVETVRYATGGVAGASLLGDPFIGSSQIVIDRSRQTLVGATFVGPSTQELLHSATVAITGEVAIERLWHAVPSFPTVSEVWLRLLEAYRQAGHGAHSVDDPDKVTGSRSG